MMKLKYYFALTCTAFSFLLLAANCNAQIVAFSNDFEDGDLDAEVGTMTLVADSSMASVVPVTDGPDDTLGGNVVLLDQNTLPLDVTLGLTDTLSLADGNTVTVDFDTAARRINGTPKTIFVDALDSNGSIVTRLVLGDNNIFGNAGADRQRPGYATLADGNLIFGGPPGSFWWGSDFDSAGFDGARDAHMSLTISAASFDFSSTSQAGVEFESLGLNNYDAVTSANIASIKLTSFNESGFGMYFDNFVVSGIVADDIEVLLGDCNFSGNVDFSDIAPFIAILSGDEFVAQADCNEDSTVNFSDIAPFIRILSGN